MHGFGHAAMGAALASLIRRIIRRRYVRKGTPPLAIHQAGMRRQMARWAVANLERSEEEIVDLVLSTDVVIAIVPDGERFVFFTVKGREKMRKLALAAGARDCLDRQVDYGNGALLGNGGGRVTTTAVACGSFRMAQGLMRAAEQTTTRSQGLKGVESLGRASPVAARLRIAAGQQPLCQPQTRPVAS